MSEGPSLVPSHKAHGAVYIVLDDFGKLGRVYRETDETAADAETVIRDLLRGEYHRPVRVIAFNTDEGWSIDASREVAAAVVDIARERQRALGRATIEFLERYMDSTSIPESIRS
jgi:hypothetical protein